MDRTIRYCGLCGDEIYEEDCMSLECRIKRDGPIYLQELPCPSCASLRAEVKMYKERWELEQIQYEGISSANEELRKSLADARGQVEWAIKEFEAYGHVTAANTLRRRAGG